MQTIRVLLADAHPLYRDGLAGAVGAHAGLEVVGTAPDGDRALELIRDLTPDVAVIDLRMPGASGLEVAERSARDATGTRILVLSAVDEPGDIVRAISAGVDGYVLKDATGPEICDAIMAVAAGRVVLAPRAQTAVAVGLRASDDLVGGPRLSDRERQVLQLTAEGLSAARVGQALHLSPATVKTHLRSIYEKLGVSERAAAVAVAMRQRLVD